MRSCAGMSPIRRIGTCAEDGIPLNQLDMAATQLAFGPPICIGARALGMILTRNDGRGVMHLIRYAGYSWASRKASFRRRSRKAAELLYHMLLSVVGQPDEAGRSSPLARRTNRWPHFALLARCAAVSSANRN